MSKPSHGDEHMDVYSGKIFKWCEVEERYLFKEDWELKHGTNSNSTNRDRRNPR